ncbi:MAG: Tad domain-containing protein [Archangium sp.]|nr:Tad domain-containing protein [Archangium sp.]MDP3157488.1 Tad domain-containing protein [Archangium sp.]MDP3572775.1 Tad domain-containing protein [Archangium sp.]
MRSRRGQNLVLLSLTMLFLALMVTMTIGLGLRIRQKHELQNLADAAAFSNAVMTARTFNNMAAVNRLEVSYWVAQAADQSLISWTGYARALGHNSRKGAADLLNEPCMRRPQNLRARRQLIDFRDAVGTYMGTEFTPAEWKSMDQAAGEESKAIQGMIAGLRGELSDSMFTTNPGNLRGEFYRQITTQQLTRQIVALSRQDDISVVDTGRGAEPNTPQGITMAELDCDSGGDTTGQLTGEAPGGAGLCLRATWNENMLLAAMGSRGNAFVTGRSQMPGKTLAGITQIAGNYSELSIVFGGKSGSAYWAASQTHGTVPAGTEAWGDDHGTMTINAGSCTRTQPVLAHVRSTHLIDQGDQHEYGQSGDAMEPDPEVHHTMGDCTPLCPSVWVRTIGFQPNNSEADAWGQPKVIVALQRDLTMKKFPWELHFKFPFSATGPASEWDGRGRELHTRTGNGMNISSQGAVATGIAYYHRRDHWEEFPNLLNPFWRATLAPIDVDASPRDMNRALSATEFRFQRDAYQALRNVGFEGLH